MFTPNINILSHPVPCGGPYPGGIAIGGTHAGRMLGISVGPVRRVARCTPLPPYGYDPNMVEGEVAYEAEIYEYSSLHLSEDFYIPFWKPYGMSVVDAAALLFQGYYDGKKAEAWER